MRIHRYLSHLIPLLLAIFTLPTLSAEEFEYEGFKFSTNPGDTTCTLIQGDYKHLTEAIIPDTAYIDTTPYAVTVIGNSAFKGCTNLSKITLNKNIKTIEINGFYGCTSLSEIVLTAVIVIREGAFCNCTSLNQIMFPASTTYIDSNMFFECMSLSEINVDPDNERYLSIDGVLYDKDITTVCAVPKTKNSVNLPESIQSIGDFAFVSCKLLRHIELPSELISIGFAGLNGCDLGNINLPKSIKTIGAYAFGGGIKIIYLPPSVNSIDGSSLLEHTFLSNPTINIGHYDYGSANNITIYCPQQAVSRLKKQFEGTDVTIRAMPEVAVEETFVQHGAEGTLAVSLDGGEILNSLQFDVTLPEGVELVADGDGYAVSLNGEAAAASHSVSASRLQSGDYRVVVFSSENANFRSGENLLSLRLSAVDTFTEGTAKIHSIVASYETTAIELADTETLLTSFLSGDANDNGAVAIDDVVATVGYILEKTPEPFVVDRADVDRNGTINVGDVSGIVKIILTNAPAANPAATQRLRANRAETGQIRLTNLTIGADNTASVALSLDTNVDFTALQADVTIPENLAVESVTLDASQASTHSIAHAMVSGPIMRVVAYSTGLSSFNTEAPLLHINLRANDDFHGGEIAVGSALASDSNASICSLGSAGGYMDHIFTGQTGASAVRTDITAANGALTITGHAGLHCEIVNAQGIMVASFTTTSNDTVPLSTGIYIVRIGADTARKVKI